MSIGTCHLILAFLCPGIVKAYDVIAGTWIEQLLSTCVVFQAVGLDLGVRVKTEFQSSV